MPLNKNAYFRYRVIDIKLKDKRHPFPTLQDLADACSEEIGQGVSTSTIEKDLIAMKQKRPAGFDAPIVYNRERKGYAYDEINFSIMDLSLENDEWEALRYAARLLFQYAEVPLFKNFKQAIEKIDASFSLRLDPEDDTIDRFIQFETGQATTGYHWITSIYEAIRKTWLLEIEYDNIYKNEVKKYEIVPCMLREHRNRWYMIGWVDARKDFLTFALDRIFSIHTTEKRQRIPVAFRPDQFLQHTVGIMEHDSAPQQVELKFFAPHHQLVRLDPLHHSQKIIKEQAKEIQVTLNVLVNPELCQRILSFGAACRVIKPASLKKMIKDAVAEMSAYYK